jgi:hypothetical protein
MARTPPSLDSIARWWTSATQEERFKALERSIKGESGAPPLETLQLAAYLAEVEAGEIGEG